MTPLKFIYEWKYTTKENLKSKPVISNSFLIEMWKRRTIGSQLLIKQPFAGWDMVGIFTSLQIYISFKNFFEKSEPFIPAFGGH